MTTIIKLDLRGLSELKKVVAGFRNARVRVGLLGNHADRFDANWNKMRKNNPTIGMEHEFGVKVNPWGRETPARSFLRMPLMTRLPRKISAIGAATWKAIIVKRSLLDGLKNLGFAAEATIQEAFNTGGWGQWQPISLVQRMRKRGSSAILIDSAQMRKAVTSKVVMKNPTP